MRNALRIGGSVIAIAASGYAFSHRSITNLNETRPEMQAVANCALSRSTVDFVVVDGGRTLEEHRINLANGKSWIKRSRHQDGAAIDIAAWVSGSITYDPIFYHKIASAFNSCSQDLGIPIIWGGTWKVQDLMHFELDRKVYP